MTGFIPEETSDEDVEAERTTYGPIASVLRELAESSIRTQVSPEKAAEAVRALEQVRDLLNSDLGGASYGVRIRQDGTSRAWGNNVIGVRNPLAPPLTIHHEPDHVWSEFTLGPQYEGPPTLVHGGVSSLILDQLLGEGAAAAGHSGMTAYLNVTYKRPTPLGRLRAEARLDRVDGWKAYMVGSISDDEGVTVEAEGLFIRPRWARTIPEDSATLRFD
ncbi:MAG: PaaI family thioesterase [Nocardioides sp.]|uniref:PaaI family thioesterase n=1 Tax=Nocardioides sp. TaxID=35761 RepID=UPI003F0135C0